MSLISRLFKEPFLQFIAIGGLIFVAYSLSDTAENAELDSRIMLDQPTQEWIYSNFVKQFRRPPTHKEMDALLQAHVVSEVKYRHALEMGLDEQDSIIRRRMEQKFDFLFGNGAADAVPEDAELKEWYADNSDLFTEPDRISFSHLYYSPDKRVSPASDAEKALVDVRQGDNVEGDRFPFEVVFDRATFGEVRNVLGPEFAEAVFGIEEIDTWTGPILSGLGVHLVRVSKQSTGELVPFEESRELVLQQWREEESERILAELIEELTDQFDVQIDSDAIKIFEYSAQRSATPEQ